MIYLSKIKRPIDRINSVNWTLMFGYQFYCCNLFAKKHLCILIDGFHVRIFSQGLNNETVNI